MIDIFILVLTIFHIYPFFLMTFSFNIPATKIRIGSWTISQRMDKFFRLIMPSILYSFNFIYYCLFEYLLDSILKTILIILVSILLIFLGIVFFIYLRFAKRSSELLEE